MGRELAGIWLIVVSAVAFGFMGIFAGYAYDAGFNVSTLLTFRFCIAAVMFWFIVFMKKMNVRVTKVQLLFLALLGVGGYAFMSTLLFSSFTYIPVSVAVMLLYTYPILVTVLARLFEKEALTSNKLLALFSAVLGIFLVLGGSFHSMKGIGILLAFCAAFVYASYIMISNRILKNVTSFVASTYIVSFAGIALFIGGIFSGGFLVNVNPIGWFSVFGVAIFSTFIAIWTFAMGLQRIGSVKSSIISTIEPVVAAAMATMLFHERLTVVQAAGGILVLGSIFILQWKPVKLKKISVIEG